jgi:uncharacterized protein YkwD
MFGSFFSYFNSTTSTEKKRPVHPSAKGVYAVMNDGVMASDSQKTIDTDTTSLSSESNHKQTTIPIREAYLNDTWLPSTSEDHNKGVPVVIRRPQYDAYNETDDKVLLKKIICDAKKLPQNSGKYASNHIMINAERTNRMVPPLRRERALDSIARDHAQRMADSNKVFHMDGPMELYAKILEHDMSFNRLGVNIARGNSIEEIHKFMMAALAERNNILDKRFTTFGVGTARTDNGYIYLVHVFGGC